MLRQQEVLLDPTSRLFAQTSPQLAILRQFQHGGGPLGGGFGVCQAATVSVDQLGDGATTRTDHRLAGGHGLDHGQAEGLVARRHTDHVEHLEQPRQVTPKAGKGDALRQSLLGDQRLELGHVLLTTALLGAESTDDDPMDIERRMLGDQSRQGLDEHPLPLARRQSPRHPDGGGRRRQPEACAQGAPLAGVHTRRQRRRVDPQVQSLDTLGRQSEGLDVTSPGRLADGQQPRHPSVGPAVIQVLLRPGDPHMVGEHHL